MPKYKLAGDDRPEIVRTDRGYMAGLRVVRKTIGNYFLSCCGLAALENFDAAYYVGHADEGGWQDKAEHLACLYRLLYDKGTVIYTLSNTQLTNQYHRTLLELGSKEISQFPNGYWGEHMIHIFQFNVRNIAGRYCNKYGEAYASADEADEADIIPVQTERGQAGRVGINMQNGFAKLPTR